MPSTLVERFRAVRPFERMELRIAEERLARGDWLPELTEAQLRYSLALAKTHAIEGSDGSTVPLSSELQDYRSLVEDTLAPLILDAHGPLDAAALMAQITELTELTRRTRAAMLQRHADHLDKVRLDQELCYRSLALVAGGGGGAGYVYVGALAALEDRGISPKLIVGSSIGSILGTFRARTREFDMATLLGISDELRWAKVFRVATMGSRYGLPAALRLYLRDAVGRYFLSDDGQPMTLGELEIPMLVVVTGLRRRALSHDIDYYEHLLEEISGDAQPRPRLRVIRRMISEITRFISELFGNPGQLRELVLGGDDHTRSFDVVDAMGFSCSVPGVLHYDIFREDPRMTELLDELMEHHDLFRLIDGGIVNNVPARPAWETVQRGRIGSRNALVVALDCFSPRLTTNPLWLPAQRLVHSDNVNKNKPFSHIYKAFQWTLSPMELIPNVAHLMTAIKRGRSEMSQEVSLIAQLVSPLPGLDGEYSTEALPQPATHWRPGE